MTRREFCAGSLAAVAAPGLGLSAFGAMGKPNLKVGVLSDIHIMKAADAAWFEKALRQFDAEKVDAVAITGDLTICARIAEMKLVSDAWFRVFPDDRRSDGTRIERIFVTGNHDVDAWTLSGQPPYGFKDRAEAERDCFYFNREKVWKELFHEDYRPVVVKEVKGYVFVLRNWISQHSFIGRETSPLKEVLAEIDGKLRRKRPFFYLQHDALDDTVNAPWLVQGAKFRFAQDGGFARSCLNGYANCLALTGHSHFSLTDEQSIWQGEFTAVNCSCLCGYAFSYPGRENGFASLDFRRTPPFEMGVFDHRAVHQGLVMEVFDDRIVFRKRDFNYGLSLGADWVVPLFGGRTVPPSGTPKYDPVRRAHEAKAPEFAADAKVAVRRIASGYRRTAYGDDSGLDKSDPHPQIEVSFPPITTAHSPSRAFEFAVCAEIRIGDCVQVAKEKRVLSPNAMQPEAKDTAPCTCLFAASDIPGNCEMRFSVVPLDCWGNGGRGIASSWMPAK